MNDNDFGLLNYLKSKTLFLQIYLNSIPTDFQLSSLKTATNIIPRNTLRQIEAELDQFLTFTHNFPIRISHLLLLLDSNDHLIFFVNHNFNVFGRYSF